jgi:tetratricopeptide (TPR) repeat protein
MENIFIQKIFALTEEILRGDYQFASMREALRSHLQKAQKIGSPRYEAEVLNTLGILHLLEGNAVQNIQYFSQGLAKARQTDDNDLKIKLLNNLSEAYLGIWDFASANQYLDEGMALGKEYQPNTLPMLYLYSNKINYHVLQGEYVKASTVVDEAWQVAENPDLLKYSRYEYLQVIFLLRNLKAVIEIALGHCEAVASPLQLAAGLAQETKNTDYHILTYLSRLYYDLICKHDEISAANWEKTAFEAGGGQLGFSPALNTAFFMLHNKQPARAKKYANLVLEQAAKDSQVPAGAVAHAHRILETIG